MTNSKEVTAEVDAWVRRLIARYSHLVDDRDFRAAADLFAEDGRFLLLGTEVNGRDSIGGWLAGIPDGATLHQVTNVVVSNGSRDGTYHAVSDLVASAKGEDGTWNPVLAGRYHDTFAGAGRDMRFTQRILTAR